MPVWGGSPPTVAQLDRSAPVPNVIKIHQAGFNPLVGLAEEIISNLGGATFGGHLLAPTQLRIRAGNAADAAAGAGARTIVLLCLNPDGSIADPVTLTTAGAVASAPTPNLYIRLQAAYVQEVGTYGGANVGPVIIETTAGVAVASIAAGFGESLFAAFTIPKGWIGHLMHIDSKVAGSTVQFCTIRAWKRPRALVFAAPFGSKRIVEQYPEVVELNDSHFDGSLTLDPLTDFWLTGQRVGGGADLAVEASFGLELRKIS